MRDEKERLLKEIMEYKFAINDMALYLDTHPCSQKALRHHNEFVKRYTELVDEYEEKYGPLSIDTEVDDWTKWTNTKWPWEGDRK